MNNFLYQSVIKVTRTTINLNLVSYYQSPKTIRTVLVIKIESERHPVLRDSRLGLPSEAIRQFQEISKRKGIELSEVEATEEAYNLINLVRAVVGQKSVAVLTVKRK